MHSLTTILLLSFVPVESGTCLLYSFHLMCNSLRGAGTVGVVEQRKDPFNWGLIFAFFYSEWSVYNQCTSNKRSLNTLFKYIPALIWLICDYRTLCFSDWGCWDWMCLFSCIFWVYLCSCFHWTFMIYKYCLFVVVLLNWHNFVCERNWHISLKSGSPRMSVSALLAQARLYVCFTCRGWKKIMWFTFI